LADHEPRSAFWKSRLLLIRCFRGLHFRRPRSLPSAVYFYMSLRLGRSLNGDISDEALSGGVDLLRTYLSHTDTENQVFRLVWFGDSPPDRRDFIGKIDSRGSAFLVSAGHIDPFPEAGLFGV